MQTYIGTKLIQAKPITRKEYYDLRGWVIPPNINPDDLIGYLIESTDSKLNQVSFTENIPLIEKEEFEKTYKSNGKFNFGHIIESLKQGKKVTRKEWSNKKEDLSNKDVFLFIIQGSNDFAKLQGYGFGEYFGEPTFTDCIFMRTANNQLVAWTPSQIDMLANDWVIVD